MLRIGLCGGVSIEIDGHRVPDSLLAGRQGRLVLAYLVCERHRSVTREELAELLWPNELPSSWPTSLSVVISKLRRMLSEAGFDSAAGLASEFGAYRLRLPENSWIDLEVADVAVQTAEGAVEVGDFDAAVAAAKEAVGIARQGFLTDDCPWVDARRERVRELHLRALLAQAQAHLLAGETSRAVLTARDAVQLDELREASYRLLMEALAASGERAEALRVWERCRIMLAEELGVDPAPATEAVYLSLLGTPTPPSAPKPHAQDSPEDPPGGQGSLLPSGVVTFLFTDIVDSSAIWDRNPAAMAIALDRHDHLVAGTVEAHGGVRLKTKLEGDATVSVFRRASSAALAALALNKAVSQEPWPDGAALQIRMAIHTGEAIERDGDYFGPALNRTARIRALAGAGQILVSQTVADVIGDHLPDDYCLQSLGSHQLRGLSREEHLFQLGPRAMDEGSEPSPLQPPPVPPALHTDGPFVGRGPELDRLAAEWAVCTSGGARATLIAGEPGVGKSRLAAEWAGKVFEQGGMVLYGRCDEELGAPYQPFTEVLRSLLPVLGTTRLRSVRGMEQLARLVPDLADLLPSGASSTQGDPDSERSLLFDAYVRLIDALSAELPVLIVVDDLHWAAKPTLLLLRHLLRAGGPATRLLIVGTYRSTDLSRSHPLAAVLSDLHRDGTAERLSLGGLDPEDVGTYLRASGRDDSQLEATLFTVTSGNPFYLIEVLRHLEETGQEWDPSSLPQGVREAVDRRLSHLSDLANEALLVGAIVGSQFSLDLVEQVVGQDLVDPIDEACRAGLLVEAPGNRFRFNHALVRQSLLAECVSVRKVRLHQRIAAVLEADSTGTVDTHLADLARHYFECAFAGGAAKAVEYSRRAGEQAMHRLAYEQGAELFAQALQAAEVEGSGCDDDQVAELLLAHCEALLAAGDPAASAVVDKLAATARHSARLSAWATCFAGQLAVLTHAEGLESAVGEVRAAADVFARLGDSEGEAKAHTVAAACLARLGRIAECEAVLDRALVAARLADNPSRVNTVLAFAPLAALWGPSPVPQASGRCLDVVRVLRITTGSAAVEAAALRCQAVLEAVRGRFDAARRMLESARRSLEALGHTHGLLETDLCAGMVELAAGVPAEGEAVLRRAYEGFSARGVRADAAQAAALLARVLISQGRIDESLESSAQAERLAGGDLRAAMQWRSARAEALARRGEVVKALDLARTAVSLVEPTDALLDRAEAHFSLAVVLRFSGEDSAAEEEARKAVDLFERKGAVALVPGALHLLGKRTSSKARSPASSPLRRRVRVNQAAYSGDEHGRLFMERRLEDYFARIPDDFVDVDHMAHVTTGRGHFVDLARRSSADGVTLVGRVLLASLGERFALFRCNYRTENLALVERDNRTGPVEFEQLQLETSDLEGRLVRLERFKTDDLHLALARMIELHAEVELGEGQMPRRQALAQSIRNNRPAWAAGAEVVDHRNAGLWNLAGPHQVREAMHGFGELSRDLTWRTVDVLGIDSNLWLGEFEATGHNTEGGPVELRALGLTQYGDDGLICRSEIYGPEQLDQALRRFDELQSRSAGAVLTNDATRILGLTQDASSRGDWEALRKVMAAEPVIDDRRRIVRHLAEGQAACFDYVISSGATRMSFEALATRGDRLVLVQVSAGGPRTEVLSLAINENSQEGKWARTTVFDPDDPDAGFAELDARYLAGEGSPQADVLAPWLNVVRAYGERDEARCRSFLEPDLTVTDHRPVQGITSKRVDEFLHHLGAEVDLAGGERLRVLAIDRLEGEHAVFLCQITRSPGDRLDPAVAFYVDCTTRQGKIAKLELFPYAAGVTSVSGGGGPTTRRALLTPVARKFIEDLARSFKNRELEELTAYFAEDFVDIDHILHVTCDRETFVRGARTPTAGGASLADPEVIASLGQRHFLLRQDVRFDGMAISDPSIRTGSAEWRYLLLWRIDDQGVAHRQERFALEDLNVALARLVELHAEDELPEERRHERDQIAANLRMTPDDSGLGTWREDVVLVDHRFAGAPSFSSRASVMAEVAAMGELHHSLVWTMNNAVAFAERVVLLELAGHGETSDGGVMDYPLLLLSEYGADGLVMRVELWTPDQAEDALARFDEVFSDQNDAQADERNAAALAIDHLNAAYAAADFDQYRSLLIENVLLDDRRPLVRTVLQGRDAVVANGQDAHAQSSWMRLVRSEVLAVRGASLSLKRLTFAGSGAHAEADQGFSEVAFLQVTEVDPQGLISYMVLLGPDDLDAALDELDSRFATLQSRT